MNSIEHYWTLLNAIKGFRGLRCFRGFRGFGFLWVLGCLGGWSDELADWAGGWSCQGADWAMGAEGAIESKGAMGARPYIRSFWRSRRIMAIFVQQKRSYPACFLQILGRTRDAVKNYCQNKLSKDWEQRPQSPQSLTTQSTGQMQKYQGISSSHIYEFSLCLKILISVKEKFHKKYRKSNLSREDQSKMYLQPSQQSHLGKMILGWLLHKFSAAGADNFRCRLLCSSRSQRWRVLKINFTY